MFWLSHGLDVLIIPMDHHLILVYQLWGRCVSSYRMFLKCISTSPARLPPWRYGFNPRPGHSGFSHVGIVPNDAVDRLVFSGISRFTRPFIQVLLHTQPQSTSSAVKTSMLRVVQISSLVSSVLNARECAIPGATRARSRKRNTATAIGKQAARQFANKRKYRKRPSYLRPPKIRARVLLHPADDVATWTGRWGFVRLKSVLHVHSVPPQFSQCPASPHGSRLLRVPSRTVGFTRRVSRPLVHSHHEHLVRGPLDLCLGAANMRSKSDSPSPDWPLSWSSIGCVTNQLPSGEHIVGS
ncbi:hypothetical protein PR048_016866 [Dryococelus australis]|uniref:Uncharacterized protein n=1 Tax=Dryococelus australis TaxID=614101 RepID=A0ABQ9H7W6_9NEOP|nr:hypothetical protein PR048_016866 [Dryococelus australis]